MRIESTTQNPYLTGALAAISRTDVNTSMSIPSTPETKTPTYTASTAPALTPIESETKLASITSSAIPMVSTTDLMQSVSNPVNLETMTENEITNPSGDIPKADNFSKQSIQSFLENQQEPSFDDSVFFG